MPTTALTLPPSQPTDNVPTILKLSDEALELILDELSLQPLYLLPANHKASLSVESFATRPPVKRLGANHEHQPVDRTLQFSQVCMRFRRLGLPRLYMRVDVRFTLHDFDRLRIIANQPSLALSVKKVSFLMPRLYSQESAQFDKLLGAFTEEVPVETDQNLDRRRDRRPQEPRRTVNAQPLIHRIAKKAENQRRILETNIDMDALHYAFGKFENLQLVRLMRVEEGIDGEWRSLLERWPRYRVEFQAEDWARSCERGSRVLSRAVLGNRNKRLSRFSSRQMDPASPLVITPTSRITIPQLASRLKYLELEFIDGNRQEDRALELSEFFKIVFSAAKGLECLHIGFRYRMWAPLPVIFHDIHFERLQHIGLHMWHLDSDELINLLRRHKNTLWSVRLRNISLKQNEVGERNWAKVISFIRSEIFIRIPSPKLKHWISLRNASYDPNISPFTHALGGMQHIPVHANAIHMLDNNDSDNVSDESSDMLSDIGEVRSETDSEAAGSSEHENSNVESSNEDYGADEHDSSIAESDDDQDNRHSDIEDEYQDTSFETVDEDTAETHLPHESQADIPRIPGQCDCDNGNGWDDLIDNGVSVSKDQWKQWQVWTVRGCARHDPGPQ